MSLIELFSCRSSTDSGRKNDRRRSNQFTTSIPERILRANDREFNEQFKYADNYIRTSKYNLITFVPLNLLEQFQRLANFYFLILMILQLVPWISSIAWYSTAIPLFVVLIFSAAKDAYDDIQRHQSDSQVNNRISYVVRNGQLIAEKWMNVKVGDIIRMENDQFVAADLLLLSTSEPHGLCYIETSELDGETNLKVRQALPETFAMGDKLLQISEFEGQIHCEIPNNKLNQFEGRLHYNGDVLPLDNGKTLLRGCVLRNTRWCYGVVIFAGKDTKLMMNSGKTKCKRTSLDRFLNILIMGIVVFLIAMCLICTTLCGIREWTIERHFTIHLNLDGSVIPNQSEQSSEQISILSFLMFFSYLILLNTVVPISLYVSVEIIRFVHSMWINFDAEMYYEKGDIAARARTTTLNEELGQVQYIFSDKTGTLTQNTMVFRKCSINGHSYGDIYGANGEVIDVTEKTPAVDFSKNRWFEPNFKFYDQRLLKDTTRGLYEVAEFWRLLALCHTSMPERKNGRLEYQAQSPDEAALTSAARNFGYVFKSRTAQTITLEVAGSEEVYDLLAILDFNNIRKRMSVIVRNPSGELILYCKGADTIILDRISHDTAPLLKSATIQHLDKFAADGFRTLCLAYKKISTDVFDKWHEKQKEAAVALTNRQEQLDRVYDELEQEMILLGATAIEDKLQDGVPETIAELARANIKIWILTGDKQETAINIGYSCNLLTENLREIFIIDGETEREVEVQLKDVRRRIEQTLGPPSSMKTNAVMKYIQQIITKVEEAEKSECKSDGRFHKTDYLYTTDDFCSVCENAPLEGVLLNAKEDALLNDGKFASQYSSDTVTENNAEVQYRLGADEWKNLEGYALVVNGPSLTYALKAELERTFLDIGCLCRAVVCCRVTPLQKAMVVDLVKRNKKAVTLAVGDGANDVSMIKTAHIGVGISGQEGMQAVLASDYSIGQFRYLRRLLLVHGRWSYFRITKFLRYFFYKNFAFTLTHFWYSFFCGYSAQSIYNPVLIACYNLFFTSLPVLAMGIFDQDLDDICSMKYAKLYIPGQYNLFFNMRIFIYSVLHGMISSLVIFFVPYGILYNGVDSTGRDFNDYSLLAFTCFTSLIIVVTGQIAFDTSYWTIFNHIVIWGSVIFYFSLSYILYEALPIRLVSKLESAQSYGIMHRAFVSLQFWLSLLMVSVILLLPVLVHRFFWLDTHPTYADRLRMQRKDLTSVEEEKPQSLTTAVPHSTTGRGRRTSLRSGYAFSHQQGFGDLIIKGELFKQVEQLVNSGSSPQKIISPIRQLAEKGTATVLTPITFFSQRSNKVAPLKQVKEEVRCMEHTESRPEGLPKISKGRNVCNTYNEDRDEDKDVNIPKSSQFLHKIIVNDDEELPFKHSDDAVHRNRKISLKQQKQSIDIVLGSVNLTTPSSPSSHANMKRETFLHSLHSATYPNSTDSGSTLNSPNVCVDIVGVKSATCEPLNETRL
ncbi:transbilayer amphipath transporter protein 2 [Loa loa]|uniref:Phospholipid-transporting ATPase n=1 Tax=Loa loa TaxID=7209 RepID=A0A1S0UFV0_LOALO|nr:transbilayer amphipath transporter protein 2 [Loa loa]EJD73724.1 transbilayer amphipath transporter protein 2 [Loa loa]